MGFMFTTQAEGTIFAISKYPWLSFKDATKIAVKSAKLGAKTSSLVETEGERTSLMLQRTLVLNGAWNSENPSEKKEIHA